MGEIPFKEISIALFHALIIIVAILTQGLKYFVVAIGKLVRYQKVQPLQLLSLISYCLISYQISFSYQHMFNLNPKQAFLLHHLSKAFSILVMNGSLCYQV